VTVRWGRRSTGGVVKEGHGGWYLSVTLGMPWVQYINPETGDAACVTGWNVRAAVRKAKATAEQQRAARLRETR